MSKSFVVAVSWLLLLFTASRVEAQWSRFRGPNGSGVDSALGYPVEFSATKNVAWKAPIPYGQSSPIVSGGRVYITASEGDTLITLSFDERSGRELWRRTVRRDRVQVLGIEALFQHTQFQSGAYDLYQTVIEGRADRAHDCPSLS